MTTLQIPYALTNNKLPVSPQVAEKGEVYSCPECDSGVFLKRGEIRTPHFAHKSDTGCSGEGVVHKVVKQMIYGGRIRKNNIHQSFASFIKK